MKRFTNSNSGISPRLQSWASTKTKRSKTASEVSRRALVICNGEPPSKKLARELAHEADLIVAADGGANIARKLGIRPHAIIGDLDSITLGTKRFFSESKRLEPLRVMSGLPNPRPKGRGYAVELMHVSRQDNTDLEKALDFLLEQDIRRATIIAATGNRLDHTLGNLSVIWNYANRIEVEFVGDGFVAIPIVKEATVSARHKTIVSLVPFGTCSGITYSGLFYPLKGATMNVGEIGVSNVVVKSPFTVEVKRGKMLMIVLANHTSVKVLP